MKSEKEIRGQLAEVINQLGDTRVPKEIKTLLLGNMDALNWVLSEDSHNVVAAMSQLSGWDEWNNKEDNR